VTAGPVTLDHVEAFAPRRTITVGDIAGSLGMSSYAARVLSRVHGFEAARRDGRLGVIDLVLVPASRVVRRLGDPAVIKYVIFAHTVLEVSPAQVDAAAVLAARLGLAGAEAFAVTNQYCASGLAAIDVAGELLRSGGDHEARALILTGEKAFASMARPIAATTVIGEASSASLVSLCGPANRVRGYASEPMSAHSEGVLLTPDAIRLFGDVNPASIVTVIERAVAAAGLGLADITMIVPHNISRLVWRKTMALLGLDPLRLYLDNLPRYSHCYCTDPFLNLATIRDEGRLVKGGIYVLTSVGIGGAYAAMAIEH
jgi:3-oxoacyl-[acyl-carrier-protein] synthase III